jgi:hypothetical protein
MSIIPNRNGTVVIQGSTGINLDELEVNEVPYKAEDGTLKSSGLRMLTSGSLLAPVGFSVESGSVDFGDVLRLSESAGFLAFENLVDDVKYQLLDYAVPRTAASSKPYYFKLLEAEHSTQPVIGSSTITTNPITYEYVTRFTARTNALTFVANQQMTNVRLRITDKVSGVALKYFPSKSIWLEGNGGTTFEVGNNVIDFLDTALIFQSGTTLVFDIQADNIALAGTNSIPTFWGTIQQGVFVGVADSNDISGLQSQISAMPTSFSGKYSDLTGIPATFTPSPHQHPTSDITGLDTKLSSLTTGVQQANSSLSGLSTVATSGNYNDLTNKPLIPTVSYPITSVNSKTGDVVLSASDVGAIGVGQSIPYSSLTGTPTIPAVVTKTSQLTNDSGYVTNVTYPVTSVNSKTGAVVLTNTDVGAAATNHLHQIADVIGLQASLDAKITVDALTPYETISNLTNTLANYTTTATLIPMLNAKFNNPTGTMSQYLRGDGTPATFPTIPAAQVNSDWNATAGVSQILNKPTLFSGSYNDLTNKPSLFSGSYTDLINKPTLFDGTYASLTGKPTTFTPSAHTHVIADVTGLQTALNAKFTTPTGTTAQYVRGDGSLATLPVIPTVVSAFTNDSGYLTTVTSGQVVSALGYTPYNATNPSAYVDQTGARAAISLTTTGTGSATYSSSTGVLNVPSPVTRTYTNPARTLNSAFQISATRDVMVSYSVDITVAAVLIAGTSGRVYLEYANEVGFTTVVTTIASCGNSTGGVLSITNLGTANLTGLVPAGKFVRLRTANVTGTPTYTFQAAQEVIL